MDDFWLVAVLVGLLWLASLIVPWIALFKTGRLADELDQLKEQIERERVAAALARARDREGAAPAVKAASVPEPAPQPAPAPPIAAPSSVPSSTAAATPALHAAPAAVSTPAGPSAAELWAQDAAPEENRKDSRGKQRSAGGNHALEINLGTKLPVWIGAVALICAAFYLVKYSVEAGWLGPVARLFLGGLFGVSLVAAGQFLFARPFIPNARRMAQGLTGAGLVALYGCLYASTNLYHILPPMAAFLCMAGVTAAAFVLSLRHGQSIAVFGLLGGILTPALIGSEEPNALLLFTYLFVLFSGVFTVFMRQGWLILGLMAVGGMFVWSLLWFLTGFRDSDGLILMLFGLGIATVVLTGTQKAVRAEAEGREAGSTEAGGGKSLIHALNISALAGGGATIAVIGLSVALTLFDWAMLGLFSLAILGLAYFSPAVYRPVAVLKLAASLLLYVLWAPGTGVTEAAVVAAGMAALYIGLPGFLMRTQQDPRFFAALQAGAAVAIYLAAYGVLTLPLDFTAPFAGFWGLLALVLASFSVHQAKTMREHYQADETINDHLVAIYALAASAFISAGLAIECPNDYLSVAFSLQLLGTVAIYRKMGIAFLARIAGIILCALPVLMLDQLFYFAGLIFDSLLPGGGGHSLPDMGMVMTLGITTALTALSLAALTYGNAGFDSRPPARLACALTGAAFLLFTGVAYCLIRLATGTEYVGFSARGFITFTFAAMGGLLAYAGGKRRQKALETAGQYLFLLAMARYFYFDLLLYNPFAAHDQTVSDMPLFNGVTLTYGLGTGLAFLGAAYPRWAAPQAWKRERIRNALGGLAFLMGFFFVTYTVRQLFHGGQLFPGDTGAAELYAYSGVWLVTGIALVALGIARDSRVMRRGSLAYMLLVIVKVFLVDAAQLEGLYRVFSFLGLGLSLIGLSAFYTRFVFAAEKPAPDEGGSRR